MNTCQPFGSTIERCPHDEENPYTQIHNGLIRDKSISPNCRMILIFLLSNKNNWKIRIPQLISEFKGYIGKELMHKIINEAIEAGYMMREDYTEKNLKRCRYYLSEKPKFKKILRHPEIRDADVREPDRQDCSERTRKRKNILNKEYISSSSEEKKKNDDDSKKNNLLDSIKEDSSDVVVTKTNGTKIQISQSQIYSHFLRLPQYSTEVIQEAISRIRQINSPINNITKYLESICQTIMNEKKQNKSNFQDKKNVKKNNSWGTPINEVMVNMGDFMKKLEEEEKKKKNE